MINDTLDFSFTHSFTLTLLALHCLYGPSSHKHTPTFPKPKRILLAGMCYKPLPDAKGIKDMPEKLKWDFERCRHLEAFYFDPYTLDTENASIPVVSPPRPFYGGGVTGPVAELIQGSGRHCRADINDASSLIENMKAAAYVGHRPGSLRGRFHMVCVDYIKDTSYMLSDGFFRDTLPLMAAEMLVPEGEVWLPNTLVAYNMIAKYEEMLLKIFHIWDIDKTKAKNGMVNTLVEMTLAAALCRPHGNGLKIQDKKASEYYSQFAGVYTWKVLKLRVPGQDEQDRFESQRVWNDAFATVKHDPNFWDYGKGDADEDDEDEEDGIVEMEEEQEEQD